jgi:hypothetical protein
MNKSVLIGTFVKKEKILTFLEYLKTKLMIDIKKIRIYTVKSNIFEYLVTFKTFNKEKYLSKIRYSIVMHVKNGCLFSINALNKLITQEHGSVNKEYELDWEKYRNKLIVLSKSELAIENITKIEDKKSLLL